MNVLRYLDFSSIVILDAVRRLHEWVFGKQAAVPKKTDRHLLNR